MDELGLYNAFLASGAPSELNIDHGLRHKLDNRMIRSNAGDEDMRMSLKEIVELFEQAQASVFKLMSSVSHAPNVSLQAIADPYRILCQSSFETHAIPRPFGSTNGSSVLAAARSLLLPQQPHRSATDRRISHSSRPATFDELTSLDKVNISR